MCKRRMFELALAGGFLVGGLLSVLSFQAWGREPSQIATPESGKLTGIVTAKTDKDITVKAEGANKPQRYRLTSQAGGAPSADVQAALKMVFVTNIVVLQWQGGQDPVVTSIHAIHSKTRFGTVTGIVAAVDPTSKMPSFDVKPISRGITERYVPRWDPASKGWDKGLLFLIAALTVGDRVKVAWSYDERKRAVQIKVIAKGKPAGAGNKAKADQTF